VLPAPAQASAAGPFPTIDVLGPGCGRAYALPANGELRMTFQNVSQSCAGGRSCSIIQDDPLDGTKVTVSHGETALSGTFKSRGEKCGHRPVWVFEHAVPGSGTMFLSAPGAATVQLQIKPSVAGSLLLDYGDFGPQAAAGKLLGQCWYQWEGHGDSDSKREDAVLVVVYRDVKLDDIKSVFPVDEATKKDYRYVTYSAALKYLDAEIAGNVLPSLTKDLKVIRRLLIKRFGS